MNKQLTNVSDYFVEFGKYNRRINVNRGVVNYWNIKLCLKGNKGVPNYHGDRKNKGIFVNNGQVSIGTTEINDGKISIGTTEFNDLILPNFEKIEDFKNLPTGSRVLEFEIKLTTPYYSADEDYFYPIDNPVKKEKVLKLPYIPGSSWKGYFLSAGKKLVQENFESGDFEEGIKKIFQLWRIFGAGGDDFEALTNTSKNLEFEDFLKSFEDIIKDKNRFEKALKGYLIFNIGTIYFKNSGEINWEKIKKYKPGIFATRKGRLKILPTFLKNISLEVLNPHNRKTRSGTQPIYFEVVPKDEIGDLRMIYVPFDLIGLGISKEQIENERDEDLSLICKLVEKAGKIGIGGKSKVWGRYEVENSNLDC